MVIFVLVLCVFFVVIFIIVWLNEFLWVLFVNVRILVI